MPCCSLRSRGEPSRNSCRSRLPMNRIGTALVVLLAWTVPMMPSFAAASPPDPLWIHGFYDAADGDDVVTCVSDTTATPNGESYASEPLQPVAYLDLQSMLLRYTAQRPLPAERGPPHSGICAASASSLARQLLPRPHRPSLPSTASIFRGSLSGYSRARKIRSSHSRELLEWHLVVSHQRMKGLVKEQSGRER
jgi:hypothetical protein